MINKEKIKLLLNISFCLFVFICIPIALTAQSESWVEKVLNFESSSEEDRVICIENRQEHEVKFNFNLNGRFYNTLNEFITKHSISTDSAQLILELFNSFIDIQVHSDVFSKWNNPLSFVTLNSCGFGLCGRQSGLFFQITRNAGYPSRLLMLGGHVAGEVFYNGKWHFFDPDRKIYFEKDGTVLGSIELIENPSLIKELGFNNYMANLTTKTVSYSDFIITTENNWYYDMNAEYQDTFRCSLPSESSFLFPFPPDCQTDFFPYNLNAKLFLPNGYNGTVNNPLVLIDAEGKGQVMFEDRFYSVPDELELLRRAIYISKEFTGSITVKSESDSFALVYMLNPKLAFLEAHNQIRVNSEKELIISTRPVLINTENKIIPTNIELMNQYAPFAAVLMDTIEANRIYHLDFSSYYDLLIRFANQYETFDVQGLRKRLEKLDIFVSGKLFNVLNSMPATVSILAIACLATEKEFNNMFSFYYKVLSYRKNAGKMTSDKSSHAE